MTWHCTYDYRNPNFDFNAWYNKEVDSMVAVDFWNINADLRIAYLRIMNKINHPLEWLDSITRTDVKFTAVNYLDRTIPKLALFNQTTREMIVHAMSCLWLALRIVLSKRTTDMDENTQMDKFLENSEFTVDPQSLKGQGLVILLVLQGKPESVLAFDYLFSLTEHLQVDAWTQHLGLRAARRNLKYMYMDATFLRYRPSVMAAAALLSALIRRPSHEYFGFQNAISGAMTINMVDVDMCIRHVCAIVPRYVISNSHYESSEEFPDEPVFSANALGGNFSDGEDD